MFIGAKSGRLLRFYAITMVTCKLTLVTELCKVGGVRSQLFVNHILNYL